MRPAAASAAAFSAAAPSTATLLAPLLDDRATGGPPDLGRPGPGPAGPRRDRPRWGGPRWRVALAAVAAGLAAVIGWLVLSSGAPPATPRLATASQPATGASTPPARTVDVNAAALAGLPARVARQRLARLGLRPHLQGAVSFRQPPGTVLSVQPSGPVAVGSVVTVLVAHRPAADQHRHGGGNGQGGGGQHGGGGHGTGGDSSHRIP